MGREGKWGGPQTGKKIGVGAVKTNHERMSDPGLPKRHSWRASQISKVPTPSCYEDRVDMGWLCLSGTYTSTCGLKTHRCSKGEKERTVNFPPPKREHCRQREVRRQEMSPINRTLCARRGVGGRNSAVCREHARGYEI